LSMGSISFEIRANLLGPIVSRFCERNRSRQVCSCAYGHFELDADNVISYVVDLSVASEYNQLKIYFDPSCNVSSKLNTITKTRSGS
jgi:hypothetical protein